MKTIFILTASVLVATTAAFAPPARRGVSFATRATPAADETPVAGIQFYDGVWEPNVPEVVSYPLLALTFFRQVKLTRSRDGENGVATFFFESPSFFNFDNEEEVPLDYITSMKMIDDEGTLTTAKVNARFVNGKPETIEARLEMVSPAEWDRFLRFMGRYVSIAIVGCFLSPPLMFDEFT